MISDQEFLELIQGLYEKTMAERLNWQRVPPSAPAGYIGLEGSHHSKTSDTPGGYLFPGYGRNPSEAYWVELPKSVIELQYGNPTAEPDFVIFSVARNRGGQPLVMRKVYEGDFGWEPLSNLYALVKRRDLGWDDVFKSMREFLGQPAVSATVQQGH